MTSKSKKYCSVPQCNNYISYSVSMHFFPKDPKLAKQWKEVLKIGKPVTKYMCVCSEHFTNDDFTPGTRGKKLKRLRQDVIPSQKIPKLKFQTVSNTSRSRRTWLQAECNENHESIGEDAIESEFASVNIPANPVIDHDYHLPLPQERFEQNIRENEVALVDIPGNSSMLDHDYHLPVLQPVLEPRNHYSYKEPIVNTLDAVIDKGIQTSFPIYHLGDGLDSDYKMRCFTGVDLNTIKTLVDCSKNILDINSQEIPDNLQMRVILVLIKLKCNQSFRCLAILFNLTVTTCTRYFYSTLSLLATVLKPVIKWPSKEEVLANMPVCFRKFLNTRVVLDCTEVPVQKSKCLRTRIKSYSHYKGTVTLKFWIGVTPSGMISYVSPAYGGRASDKGIFNNENFISKLDPHDGVMVDKGFMIEKECEGHYLKLIRPPFLGKKKQLSKEQADLTAEIARARIHVERAIQRLKIWKIVSSKIEWYLIPHMDDVMIVTAALVNLSPPILSSDRF